ncbi:MAG: efflux RND transporter periplasmic adaptor subunit, partial [Candidatus Kapabacteria bacterium]|nr:efflux RND transporter periplasmic adaptor subunit [Candidatus Kapabacteria bacterium]
MPTVPTRAKSAAVTAVLVKPQPYTETVTLTGSVTADQSVELRAEVAGRITKIGFVEGRQVRKGQLLVKLNDSELVARRQKIRQQAELDLRRKMRLEKLRAVDGSSLDEYESATSQVEMRAAETAEIDAQIAQTEIRAPFSGVVGLRNISVGAVITPQTILTSLTSTGVLNIDCSVPERFASAMR